MQVLRMLANVYGAVVYLGHKIDRDGLHPTDEKVRAIQDAPHPTNVKELRAWLGLLNYYGRFLCNLSTTLAPLHVLLRKETKWQWGKDQNEAFVAAKNLLQSDSLLVHFDQDKPIPLACDINTDPQMTVKAYPHTSVWVPIGCSTVLWVDRAR